MKPLLLAFAVFTHLATIAQKDSIPSGVYSWSKAAIEKTSSGERRNIVGGSTLDLTNLKIHTSTLLPGQTNHPPKANLLSEELIIIKEGMVEATVEDSTKELGPGGIILLLAGDKQSFTNTSNQPVTYYVLIYNSKDGLNVQRGKQAGSSFMKNWNELTMTATDKGESRPIFDRPSTMFKRFDVHATALNPGFASHLPHTHRAEEIILMIKGSGQMQIGTNFYPVTTGDVVLLNSNIPHALKNNGSTQCGYFAIQWHSNAE